MKKRMNENTFYLVCFLEKTSVNNEQLNDASRNMKLYSVYEYEALLPLRCTFFSYMTTGITSRLTHNISSIHYMLNYFYIKKLDSFLSHCDPITNQTLEPQST